MDINGTNQNGVVVWDNTNREFDVLDTAQFAGVGTNIVTATDLYTLSSTTYSAIVVDYVVKNNAGGYRVGTFRAVQDGNGVEFDETSTKDLGGTTTDCRFIATSIGPDFKFVAVVGAGSFNITFSIKAFLI